MRKTIDHEPVAHCSKDPDPPYLPPPKQPPKRPASKNKKRKIKNKSLISDRSSQQLEEISSKPTTNIGGENHDKLQKMNTSQVDEISTTSKTVFSMSELQFSLDNDRDEDPFDKLFKTADDHLSHPGKFIKSKNVRTYVNKHKRDDIEILEFHDCKNRDMIIKWLNNNQDNFEKLTQSQTENLFTSEDDDYIPSTFDMPSVSQSVLRSPRKRKELKVTINSNFPRLVRAKSLDSTPTGLKSTLTRFKSYSVAGDDPNLENYEIEDSISEKYDRNLNEEDVLMEDQCLSEIEREMAREMTREMAIYKERDQKKDVDGWKRVKEMGKMIKKMNRTPKKLDVVIQVACKSNSSSKEINSSPPISLKTRSKRVLKMPDSSSEENSQSKVTSAEKGPQLMDTSKPEEELEQPLRAFPTYNLRSIRNSQVQPQEKPASTLPSPNDKSKNSIKEIEETPTTDVVTLGKNFVESVRKITDLDTLKTLRPFLIELNSVFNKFGMMGDEDPKVETKDAQIQTMSDIYYIESGTMTDVAIFQEAETQTESALISTPTTNSSPIAHQNPENTLMPDSLDYVCFDTQDIIQQSLKSKNQTGDGLLLSNNDDVRSTIQQKITQENVVGETLEQESGSQKVNSKSNKRRRLNTSSTSSQCRYPLRSQSSSLSQINLPPKKLKERTIALESSPKMLHLDFEASLTFSGSLKGYKRLARISPRKSQKLNDTISLPRRSPRFNRENESQLICSPKSSASQRLSPRKSQVKKVLMESLENEIEGGRPCQKFINEDLSVCFDSNSQNYESQAQVPENVHLENDRVIVIDEPELVQDKVVDNQLKDTQNMIAHCDEIIYNATKPAAAKVASQDDPFSDEIFQCHSIFLNEENLKKIEIDINKQNVEQLKQHDDNEGNADSNVIPETDTFTGTKTSQKRLFDELDPTEVVADSQGHFEQESFHVIENEEYFINNNKRRRPEIIIIEDVTIRGSFKTDEVVEVLSGNSTDEIFDSQSDCDMIEATPQKSYPTLRFNVQKRDIISSSQLEETLPPPTAFRDDACDSSHESHDMTAINSSCSPIKEKPAQRLNNMAHHSTPQSRKPQSQSCPLSPITQGSNMRVLGPYDWALSGDSHPFTIKSTPSSQRISERSFSIKTPTATKQNSMMKYVRQLMTFLPSPNSQPVYKPCLACSRIPKEDVILLTNLANKKLVTYSTSFGPNVTHMIVKVDVENRVQDHTIKYILAISAGIWIVSIRWVLDCLEANRLVPEESYEVDDLSGVDGPRQSRLNRKSKPLLKGYKIYVAPPFATTTRSDIETVVRSLGGVVAAEPEELLDKNGFVCVIVCEAIALVDFEMCETWLEVLKVVTVDIEWLSRSVSQYKILSFRNHTLCSDDSISQLDYPPELLDKVPYTCSTSASTLSK